MSNPKSSIVRLTYDENNDNGEELDIENDSPEPSPQPQESAQESQATPEKTKPSEPPEPPSTALEPEDPEPSPEKMFDSMANNATGLGAIMPPKYGFKMIKLPALPSQSQPQSQPSLLKKKTAQESTPCSLQSVPPRNRRKQQLQTRSGAQGSSKSYILVSSLGQDVYVPTTGVSSLAFVTTPVECSSSGVKKLVVAKLPPAQTQAGEAPGQDVGEKKASACVNNSGTASDKDPSSKAPSASSDVSTTAPGRDMSKNKARSCLSPIVVLTDSDDESSQCSSQVTNNSKSSSLTTDSSSAPARKQVTPKKRTLVKGANSGPASARAKGKMKVALGKLQLAMPEGRAVNQSWDPRQVLPRAIRYIKQLATEVEALECEFEQRNQQVLSLQLIRDDLERSVTARCLKRLKALDEYESSPEYLKQLESQALDLVRIKQEIMEEEAAQNQPEEEIYLQIDSKTGILQCHLDVEPLTTIQQAIEPQPEPEPEPEPQPQPMDTSEPPEPPPTLLDPKRSASDPVSGSPPHDQNSEDTITLPPPSDPPLVPSDPPLVPSDPPLVPSDPPLVPSDPPSQPQPSSEEPPSSELEEPSEATQNTETEGADTSENHDSSIRQRSFSESSADSFVLRLDTDSDDMH